MLLYLGNLQASIAADRHVFNRLGRQHDLNRLRHRDALFVVQSTLKTHTQCQADTFQLQGVEHPFVAFGFGRWRFARLHLYFHIADDLNIFKAGDEDFAFVGQRGPLSKKSDEQRYGNN